MPSKQEPRLMLLVIIRGSCTKCRIPIVIVRIFFIIKLACESQLTEILFKLLIKLACESQLIEILFKLLIIIIIIIIINLLRLNLQFYLLLEL